MIISKHAFSRLYMYTVNGRITVLFCQYMLYVENSFLDISFLIEDRFRLLQQPSAVTK